MKLLFITMLIMDLAGCRQDASNFITCKDKMPSGYRLVKNMNGNFIIKKNGFFHDDVLGTWFGEWSFDNIYDHWRIYTSADSCAAKNALSEYLTKKIYQQNQTTEQ